MINLKEYVSGLFFSALEGEKSVSRLNTDDSTFAYYDEESDYERHYYYNDIQETIAKRILMDPEVESFLPMDRFMGFFIRAVSSDTVMVMEKLVFLWENEEGRSKSRDAMENEYGDGYAQYIADGFLGQTWTDRQIPVINVSAILESCQEIHMPGVDPPFKTFFLEAVLQTMFHELRHLFYECNEIVPTGEGTLYPIDGGLEDKVEDYGNAMASRMLNDFLNTIDMQALDVLLQKRGEQV